MRRWRHDSHPSARHLNDLTKGIDGTRNLMIALGGGGDPVVIFGSLRQQLGFEAAAWQCDGVNTYKLLRHSHWKVGLDAYAICQKAYSWAIAYRALGAGFELITGRDFLLNGSPNVADAVIDTALSPSGFCVGDLGFAEGGVAVWDDTIPPGEPGIVWPHNSPRCNGSQKFWAGPAEVFGGTGATPKWAAVVEDEGLYSCAPLFLSGGGYPAYNLVGALPPEAVDVGVYDIPLPNATIAGGAMPFTLPDWIQQVKRGTTVEKAWVRVRFFDAIQHEWHYTSDGTTQTLTDDTSEESVGLMLVGRRINENGTRTREIIGGAVGGSATNGKWRVVDFTGAINSMLAAKEGTWDKDGFCLLPTTISAELETRDMRNSLKALLPNITLAYYENTANTTAVYMEGSGDFNYVSDATGRYVQWGSFEVGAIELEGITAPTGQGGRSLVYGNWPRAD